jgi:hypothetical protein
MISSYNIKHTVIDQLSLSVTPIFPVFSGINVFDGDLQKYAYIYVYIGLYKYI